jgi:predicted sulfurtransferase
MSHRHLCDVTGHMWVCAGTAIRLGDKDPSVCMCHSCRSPLEQGDHSRCKNLVELIACPEHRDEQLRRRQEAEKEFERRAAEFGFEQKWARMKALPAGPEKDALAEEIVKWLFA